MITNWARIRRTANEQYVVGPECDSVAVITVTHIDRPRVDIIFPPDWGRDSISNWKCREGDVCELKHKGLGEAATITITKISSDQLSMVLQYPPGWVAYSKEKFEGLGRNIKPKLAKKLPR